MDSNQSLKVIIISCVVLVLTLTVMIAFFSAQSQARDRIRVQDVALITKFLETYKTNQGYYPPASNGLQTDWQKYLEKLPVPPPADGSCSSTQNKYHYEVANGGLAYTLSFCLGSGAGGYHAGLNTIHNP